MAVHDFNAQRLFCDTDLDAGAVIECLPEQANYLLNVLRLKTGDCILVFNGRAGEWRARIEATGKRKCRLTAEECVRRQTDGPDIDYVFAPLKRARLDYMVQKATELGVGRLQPVFTRYTVAERVNLDRMRANAIEAAEQCGVMRVPQVSAPVRLQQLIETWPAARPLIFADEAAPVKSPVAALEKVAPGPVAVLVGPEGGFSPEERKMLAGRDFTVRLSLGPRVMRADTAAVAVLALVNAVIGDWRTFE